MGIINIILTIDRNFIQHAGVTLHSLFTNNPESSFNIVCIFDDDISHLKKLSSFVRSSNQSFEVHTIDKQKVRNFKVTSHVSGATYYRLFLPDILTHIKRGIYLDSDVLVLGDIRKLWEEDLMNFTIGAVFQKNQEYFNGGVLLIDFNKWRNEDISTKLTEWLNKNNEKVEFWDQDALNAVLSPKTLSLPKKWNQPELRDKEGILHYMGSHKPWNYHCSHPNKDLYFTYLSETPWRNFKFKEQTLIHISKQHVKKILNKTGLFNYEIY